MRSVLAAALLVALIAPAVASAQGGSAPATVSPQLQTEITRKRTVVQPRPDPGTVARDADEAVSAMEQRAREDRVLQDARETVLPQLRRPDRGYDVTGGIQSRNLGRVLK
jgi:hypothetical protein